MRAFKEEKEHATIQFLNMVVLPVLDRTMKP
jgi:hypothetical protein